MEGGKAGDGWVQKGVGKSLAEGMEEKNDGREKRILRKWRIKSNDSITKVNFDSRLMYDA